jgi:hypothetical protein
LVEQLGDYRAATFVGEDCVLLSNAVKGAHPLLRVSVATGKQEVVSPTDGEWTEPIASPDGATLVLGRERGGTRDVWLMYRP